MSTHPERIFHRNERTGAVPFNGYIFYPIHTIYFNNMWGKDLVILAGDDVDSMDIRNEGTISYYRFIG